MASEGISQVGARLSLLNTPAFLRDSAAAADNMDRLAAALDKVAAAGDGAAASVDRVDAATVANKDAAAGTAALTAAETEHAVAADASAAAVGRATKAVEQHKSALDSLASNSVVKKGAVVGLGLAAAAYETVKQYSDYQSKITQLVTQANIPMADKNYYLKEGIALSDQLGVKVNSVADAYYRVASSATALHLSRQQITDYTKNSLELGILAGGNMTPSQIENSSRVIGSMMNANLKGATTPAQITALINSAVGSGDIRMSDMIGSIGKGGLSAAHQVGISAPDLMAWIDSMTKMGGTPSQSGTLVAHAIQQMAGGSEQEQHVEQMIGIAPGQLQQIMSSKGIPAAMQFLQNSMQHFNPLSYYTKFGTAAPGRDSALAQLKAWGIMTPEELNTWTSGGTLSKQDQANVTNQLAGKMFGGARQETPEQVILSGQVIGAALNSSKFAQLDQAIRAGSTSAAFQKDLSQAENTPKFQMQRAEAQLQNVMITIGQSITPTVTGGLKALGEAGEYLASHKGVLMAGLGVLAAYAGTSLAVMGASHVEKNVKGVKKIWDTVRGIGGRVAGSGSTVGALAPEGVFSEAVDVFSAAVERFSFSGSGGLLGGAEKGATQLVDKNGFPVAKSSATNAIEQILGGGISTAEGSTATGAVGKALPSVEAVTTASQLPSEGAAAAAAVGTMAGVVAPLAASAALGLLFSWIANYHHPNPGPQLPGRYRIAGTHVSGTLPDYHKNPNALNVQANLPFGLQALHDIGVGFHDIEHGLGVGPYKGKHHPGATKAAPLTPAGWQALGLVLSANKMSAEAHAAPKRVSHFTPDNLGSLVPVGHGPDPLAGLTSGKLALPSTAELKAAAAAHVAAAAKVAEAASLTKTGSSQLNDAAKDEKAAGKTSGAAADQLKKSAEAHIQAAAALQAAAASISNASAGGAAQLAAAVNTANANLHALK